MGKGNHHQFKKLLIVKKILLFSIRGNVKRQVWRMWMLSLGCIEFIAGLFWVYFKNLFIVPFVFFLWSLDGAYASNSQSDPDFRQAVGPTAHHYPGLVTTKNMLFDNNVSVDLSTIYFAPCVPSFHSVYAMQL